jgi:hypothetical protein
MLSHFLRNTKAFYSSSSFSLLFQKPGIALVNSNPYESCGTKHQKKEQNFSFALGAFASPKHVINFSTKSQESRREMETPINSSPPETNSKDETFPGDLLIDDFNEFYQKAVGSVEEYTSDLKWRLEHVITKCGGHVITNSPDDDNEEVKPSLEERIVERYFNENLQVK